MFLKSQNKSFQEFKKKRDKEATIPVEYSDSGLKKDPTKIIQKMIEDKK